MQHAVWKTPCSKTGPRLQSNQPLCPNPPDPCPSMNHWRKHSASRSRRHGKDWPRAGANSTPARSERVEYRTRLDPLVRRQVAGWKLSDSLLVDVHLHLNDQLPVTPDRKSVV